MNYEFKYVVFISFTDIPQSVLSLGSSLNGSNIKEGDDVYFECSIRANPKPYKISWRFNVSIVNVCSLWICSFGTESCTNELWLKVNSRLVE